MAFSSASFFTSRHSFFARSASSRRLSTLKGIKIRY
jgi:hypothetical protein